MALRTKTIEYAFAPRLTPLATGTTLAAATRYDAASLTLNIPETTSRTFRSVVLRVSWRCAITTTVSNVSGWRLGIKLGAVAFDDLDYLPTAVGNSGDHEWGYIDRDVTSYFATNFGSGSSQTAQAAIAMSHAAANNVNNLTLKLIITYEYDDGATTQVKTVRIPIQSHHALLTTSQVEVGTTGGTNNAPANQIPLLDDFLPEDSVVVRRAWIEVHSNDGGNATTTDFNFIYQIDSATEVTHVLCEQGLATSVAFYTHIIYDTGTFATSAAHAFKGRSDLTSRFDALGAVLYVTYEYDPASATILNSLLIPVDIAPGPITFSQVFEHELWIEEPGTIDLKQSGVLLYPRAISGANLFYVNGRSYALTSGLGAGGYAVVHRVDVGSSPIVLARGKNIISAFLSLDTTLEVRTITGFWIVNYHSGKHSSGVGVHNQSRHVHCIEFETSTGQSAYTSFNSLHLPIIPETDFFINAVGHEIGVRQLPGAASANVFLLRVGTVGASVLNDADFNAALNMLVDDAELSVNRFANDCTRLYNRVSSLTGKRILENDNGYEMIGLGVNPQFEVGMWYTYHGITWTVSGQISGYAGDGSGITVNVHRVDTGEIVASGQSASGGTYSIKVYDAGVQHYAEAYQDATHLGRSPNGLAT